MQEITALPTEFIAQLLERARASLNAAVQEGAERSAWADYRRAEILYATAMFHLLRNQLIEAHASATAAYQQVQQLRRRMTDRMNPTRESTSSQLEECSHRMEKLRVSFRDSRDNLSPPRNARCKKALHQGRERFNAALAAFVTSDYVSAQECLVMTQSHLDTVERTLNQRYENEDDGFGVLLDDDR